MLADNRSIYFRGRELIRTPLIVRSFSSKGFPEVSSIISVLDEYITDAVLVSAYDVHHKNIARSKLGFSKIIFLDSGGYEAAIDDGISELRYVKAPPKHWRESIYRAEVDRWKNPRASDTVLVSYDHPKHRHTVAQQISRAIKLYKRYPLFVREILFKPEPEAKYVDIKKIVQRVHELSNFDVIGLTEDELGKSLSERMEAVAKLRVAMTRVDMKLPIHIFGSLDPVATPLYFLSGADIFDGLTWLRFAYKDGCAIYTHNFVPLNIGVDSILKYAEPEVWLHNHHYLDGLQREMRTFATNKDFGSFTHHAEFFRKTCTQILAQVAGG